MSFTDELYNHAKPIWDKQLEHPFVKGLGDGSLDPEIFKRWVCQDYRYLKEFSRIFAWGVAKSDRLESMGWFAGVLNMTLNTEMALHREYAQKFNISHEELEQTPMWPTTRAYTDFLVRTAADGSMSELLAALLPCAWGYYYIGTEMKKQGNPDDQRYTEWIEQYASDEFGEAAEWLKNELNRVTEGATDDHKNQLIEIFVISSRYEWLFWDMCWKGEEWPV